MSVWLFGVSGWLFAMLTIMAGYYWHGQARVARRALKTSIEREETMTQRARWLESRIPGQTPAVNLLRTDGVSPRTLASLANQTFWMPETLRAIQGALRNTQTAGPGINFRTGTSYAAPEVDAYNRHRKAYIDTGDMWELEAMCESVTPL